jgi:hypothetical protein
MKLSDHIRECEQALREYGDIDVLTPSRGLIECDDCGRVTENKHFEEPSLRVATHPLGGGARVLIIEQ